MPDKNCPHDYSHVPTPEAPGTYDITMTCKDCGESTTVRIVIPMPKEGEK